MVFSCFVHCFALTYDSAACSDFGDCKRITTVATIEHITRPYPTKSDGEQNLNTIAQKEEQRHSGNSSMDSDNSNLDQKEFNSDKGASSKEKEVDECSLLETCISFCAPLSPVDADDMIRCISGDLLTTDNIEACMSQLDEEKPDGCIDMQTYSSDQEISKSLQDVDFDMKVQYSPYVIKDSHGEIQQMCSLDSSEPPVNTYEPYFSSSLHLNKEPERELRICVSVEGIGDDNIQTDPHAYIGGKTLDQLNDDALYHIASFLEARVVRFALIFVCRRFYVMFFNETYWKFRTLARWPKPFPAVPSPPDFDLMDTFIERENNYDMWKDVAHNKVHFKYSYNLFGGVDAIHLMKEGLMAVCGDRSRTLNLIDLSKYPGSCDDEAKIKDMLIHSDRMAHQGWIWSIASAGNHIVTGSWDTYVRLFDLEAGCKLTSSFKCHSSVLCLYAEVNETVASCSDRRIYFFDRRTSDVRFETFHRKPVLCVTGNDNFIISGSEDKSISVYDRRAGKIFMKVKVKDYPLCMSYTGNHLWFGDRTGNLHLHDGTDGLFVNIGAYDVGHTEKMTGVVSTRSSVFTCSGDRTIKVLHPTQAPDPVITLAIHEKEIAKIDYQNGVLVSAGGDDCIGVWMPTSWTFDTYLF